MPYTYHIDIEHELVVFKATGAFTTDILFTCLKDVTSDPKFKTTFNHLVDLRDVNSFPASSEDMHNRVELDNKMSDHLGACKIALVSSNDIVFGMTRMYEMMMDNAPQTVKTYRDIEEAKNWLGTPKI